MYLIRALLVFLAILSPGRAQPAEVPAVAAAADLKFALERIAANFERDVGRRVKLSFGSSGNFAVQIENGAPFELFLSADEDYVYRLADRGLTRDRGTRYAVGRVVVFAPHHSPLAVDAGLTDLGKALGDGRLRRFAIANPEHAPYGRAARAVLIHAGLWEAIETRLVLGENAAQATQFAASGAAEGGMIPLSLSQAPEVQKLGRFALVPAEWHENEPLNQRMVLLRDAGPTAVAFYQYLQAPETRAVLARFGFSLPDEG